MHQMPSAIESVRLSQHPTATSEIVGRIDARIQWMTTERLAIRYVLEGDCARIRIPAPRPPRRADGLWRRTCFEIFLLKPDREGYFEYNFAPSGEWALYDFTSYREAAPLVEVVAPEIFVERREAGLEVDTAVVLPPPLEASRPLNIGVASVIEDNAGALSYWALRHPSGKPDFHHRDNFMLELSPARLAAGRSIVGK
jgi:hypothetical protein